jgi:hypothetical protein
MKCTTGMLCAIFKNNNHNQTPDAETNVGFLGANKHHESNTTRL